MAPGSDAARAALDMALDVGRKALVRLRHLKNEIADAEEAANADMFWPLALFTILPRFRRRQRIRAMTAESQQDLEALDAAVDALAAAGVLLPDRDGLRASTGRRVSPKLSPPHHWEGPMHLVDVTMRRVQRMLEELRVRRHGAGSAGDVTSTQ